MTYYPSRWNPPPDEGDAWEGLWQRFCQHMVDLGIAIRMFSMSRINAAINNLLHDFGDLWEGMENFAQRGLRSLRNWIEDRIDDLWTGVGNALATALAAWNKLGGAIIEGIWTATTWASYQANLIWLAVLDRFDDARQWALDAWEWVRDRAGIVWDWISHYSFVVWNWIRDHANDVWNWIRFQGAAVWTWVSTIGQFIARWWLRASGALDTWVDTYMDYYQTLFENYRNDLLDILEDPIGWVEDIVVERLEFIIDTAITKYW